MDPNIRRNYWKGDYAGMARLFEQTDWKSLTQDQDIDATWTMFTKVVEKAMSEFIPMYRPRKRRPKPIWMKAKERRAVKHKYSL